jgi:hypothetical protein
MKESLCGRTILILGQREAFKEDKTAGSMDNQAYIAKPIRRASSLWEPLLHICPYSLMRKLELVDMVNIYGGTTCDVSTHYFNIVDLCIELVRKYYYCIVFLEGKNGFRSLHAYFIIFSEEISGSRIH